MILSKIKKISAIKSKEKMETIKRITKMIEKGDIITKKIIKIYNMFKRII